MNTATTRSSLINVNTISDWVFSRCLLPKGVRLASPNVNEIWPLRGFHVGSCCIPFGSSFRPWSTDPSTHLTMEATTFPFVALRTRWPEFSTYHHMSERIPKPALYKSRPKLNEEAATASEGGHVPPWSEKERAVYGPFSFPLPPLTLCKGGAFSRSISCRKPFV